MDDQKIEEQHVSPEPRNVLTIPIAIIVAGAIIAGAVLYTKSPGKVVNDPYAVKSEGVVSPVSAKDHILGDPNAPLTIIEYSDFSCPFCKQFHPTMRKIMDEYGKSGQVAWVYRHFPLSKPDSLGRVLHKNAGKEAEASECAAELGGNAKFWEFTNRLYEITPSVTGSTPEGLPQTELPKIAQSIGLDKAKFQTCLDSGRYADKVDASYIDGINAGVIGTPYSIVITKDGKQVPINGAQPYSDVKTAVDALLTNAK